MLYAQSMALITINKHKTELCLGEFSLQTPLKPVKIEFSFPWNMHIKLPFWGKQSYTEDW